MITKEEIAIIETLLETCILYDFNDKIKHLAILFMRNQRLIMPDAIIVATSQYYHLPFLTADTVFENTPLATVLNL